MTEIDVSVVAGPVRHLPVPVTSVDVVIDTSFRTFYGWSLREASGDLPAEAEGSVTTPAAGATIATTAAMVAGTYLVTWDVQLGGTPAAADANNFELLVGATVIQASVNQGAVGDYPQGTVEVQVPAGASILIKAIGAGTAGAVYTASLQATPPVTGTFQAQWLDNQDSIGESSGAIGESDTQYFGDPGVYLNGTLKLHVVAGTVTGTVYVAD